MLILQFHHITTRHSKRYKKPPSLSCISGRFFYAQNSAMKQIFIKSKNNDLLFKDLVAVNDAKTYQVNFNQWAKSINDDVSSVSWSVENGQATISNTTLTDNVASALITFNGIGRVFIEIKAITATEIKTIWLDILVKDPAF